MWRSQAEAEGLTLLVADNKTGYYGVILDKSCKPKPYKAQGGGGGGTGTGELFKFPPSAPGERGVCPFSGFLISL